MEIQSNQYAMKLARSRLQELRQEAYVASLESQKTRAVISRWTQLLSQLVRPQPRPVCCAA